MTNEEMKAAYEVKNFSGTLGKHLLEVKESLVRANVSMEACFNLLALTMMGYVGEIPMDGRMSDTSCSLVETMGTAMRKIQEKKSTDYEKYLIERIAPDVLFELLPEEQEMFDSGEKIAAIKTVRARTGASLPSVLKRLRKE